MNTPTGTPGSPTANAASLLTGVFTTSPGVNPQVKSGWHALCAAPRPVRPGLLTQAQWDALTPNGRAERERLQLMWNSSLTAVQTPQMLAAHAELDLALLNLVTGADTARPGFMLSGPAYAGKSTIAIAWGKKKEIQARHENGMPLPVAGGPAPRLANLAEYLPVAYFSADRSVGGTMYNGLRFYNSVIPRGMKIAGQIALLADHINHCATRIVIIDQMQEIAAAPTGAGSVSAAVKALTDQCTDTLFVGAGIGVENLHIFSDGYSVGQANLGQTGGRFAMFPVPSLAPVDEASKAVWLGVLNTLEWAFSLKLRNPVTLSGRRDTCSTGPKGSPGR